MFNHQVIQFRETTAGDLPRIGEIKVRTGQTHTRSSSIQTFFARSWIKRNGSSTCATTRQSQTLSFSWHPARPQLLASR